MKSYQKWCLALGLAFSQSAWSHSDDMLKDIKPPHGGILAVSGHYHLELVLQPKQARLYVTDHAMTPSKLDGASGEATLLVHGKTQKVKLALKGDHLSGPASIPSNSAATVVIKAKIEGETQSARFNWPAGGPAKKSQGK